MARSEAIAASADLYIPISSQQYAGGRKTVSSAILQETVATEIMGHGATGLGATRHGMAGPGSATRGRVFQ